MRKQLWGALIGLMGVAVAGCGGGGGGGAADTFSAPVADISGAWSIQSTSNPWNTILTNCTGDFAVLNGMNYGEILAQASDCGVWVPVATQSGDRWSLIPYVNICGTRHGGSGSVVGDSVSGTLSAASSSGTGTEFMRGAVSGRLLAISLDRITIAGEFTGGCTYSPSLSLTFEIVKGTGGQGLRTADLPALVRKLNGR